MSGQISNLSLLSQGVSRPGCQAAPGVAAGNSLSNLSSAGLYRPSILLAWRLL